VANDESVAANAKMVEKAFDFAQEVTKQVLTLSTGVLALTVTFLKDIATAAPHSARLCLEFGWLCFLLSVLFGVAALMSLSGNLATSAAPSIYSSNIKWPARLQLLLFLVGLLLTLIFGWIAI
jgi:hypothetical protein